MLFSEGQEPSYVFVQQPVLLDAVAVLQLDQRIAMVGVDLFFEVEVSDGRQAAVDVLVDPVEDRLADLRRDLGA